LNGLSLRLPFPARKPSCLREITLRDLGDYRHEIAKHAVGLEFSVCAAKQISFLRLAFAALQRNFHIQHPKEN
jgi:hypothetical protein